MRQHDQARWSLMASFTSVAEQCRLGLGGLSQELISAALHKECIQGGFQLCKRSRRWTWVGTTACFNASAQDPTVSLVLPCTEQRSQNHKKGDIESTFGLKVWQRHVTRERAMCKRGSLITLQYTTRRRRLYCFYVKGQYRFHDLISWQEYSGRWGGKWSWIKKDISRHLSQVSHHLEQ